STLLGEHSPPRIAMKDHELGFADRRSQDQRSDRANFFQAQFLIAGKHTASTRVFDGRLDSGVLQNSGSVENGRWDRSWPTSFSRFATAHLGRPNGADIAASAQMLAARPAAPTPHEARKRSAAKRAALAAMPSWAAPRNM